MFKQNIGAVRNGENDHQTNEIIKSERQAGKFFVCYNESTKVCVTDTSGCCNVQTKSSEESVVMVRENKENFTDIPFDCSDILKCWSTISGEFTIYPEGIGALEVQCDMNTDTGGWTVIQNRNSSSTMFYTDWAQYKNGFGIISSDFWIGNDNLHMLTSKRNYQLRVDLVDWNGETRYAVYKIFIVGDEDTQYKLSIDGYSGTAGDSFYYHNDMKFSTRDFDNDLVTDPSIQSCAQQYSGGWWYMTCYQVNLHGTYLAWEAFGGEYYDLKHSKMMIRV
ncbi:Tenascin-R,Ryncolin-2,Ficolin-1-A,Ryncolin-1,Fibrinogen C domain-containing protein 1,Fibrinogen C domain-containing protein 1-B,Ficolin-2,Fibrinogen-like protein 1,Tenascin,Ficolin-1,Microfibril-associated glycoprotein 4,Ficolin-1-B,Ryncolin-3,Angiopoietin-related protein 7,Techylectin-5A,Angiopoietin-4 [Mytilus edulis]|uniref:Fibrinogen C-terminal domain-containing protein n=1 Tax=Mytilus edulis TaxID=6550 RepID=A0A8S3Q013_MYTED|nr:Tenascin-R,Ryncolin-2,Ficolin-1-A,Ryncolin-1,Fibrinogen C domain-containing protein 1,Fibrinogen C domain-containing protein 1-B,Ficolin-2,Fibrinogen-like protein 1,Tenascin,Ficolin-1,Microfibril-associated glycoprotein 4,Ficolin-1-B,Ryncolin-3,Angiopoietin-related protein 7,Techylectin-5A,Angiopoietin-4 [Mytilus edulis]